MSHAPLRARQQQRVEELCAASIRALAGEADLHFRGGRLHRAGRALPPFGPHLHPSLETDDFGSFRGAADGIALRLARSDTALHRSLAPADPVARLIFDLLEQLRVESLAPDAMPGVKRNLAHPALAGRQTVELKRGEVGGGPGGTRLPVAGLCRP